jgi:hypothetical protein
VASLSAACVAIAAASLALPGAPSFDPWAWIVFGKEIVDPGLAFSTHAPTGWKPLAVIFTAPFALFGDVAPSLWLVVVRSAGLAALALAFRLGWRAGGTVAGALATIALLASTDWLRYLAAGNIEPFVIALLFGAIELHVQGRRGGAFVLVALAGLGRPEAWLLAGPYALYLLVAERRWWPLVLGVPAMLALWIVPDWIGSGDLLHTFHAAQISAEPKRLQETSDPAFELVRGAGDILPVPVWIAALFGAVLGWRDRDPTVRALVVVVLVWAVPTIVGTAFGYPAVPRYLVEPAAMCCVLAGIGVVAVVRLAANPRVRAALGVGIAVVSIPFLVPRAEGLADQASDSQARADEVAALWRAVDRARERAPIDGMRAVVKPQGMANGLAWKLDLQLRGVSTWFSPAARLAFINGDEQAVVARLRRRDATARRLTAAGPWQVLVVRWPGTA